MSVLAVLIAGGCTLGWLMARGTPRWAAVAIALVIVLDPIMITTSRSGRVDGWAFAACLASIWLLRLALNRAANGREARWPVFLAGISLGTAPFFWISAGFLVPLALLEFFCLLRAHWHNRAELGFGPIRASFLWIIAGGLTSLAVLILPIAFEWQDYAANSAASVEIQKMSAVIKRSFLDMFLLYDPLLLPVLLASLAIRREWGLVIAMIAAVFMMNLTMVYPARIIYLLPYFAGIIGGALTILSRQENIQWRRMALYCLLGMLLLWNAWTVLIRPLIVLPHQQEARSPQNILSALDDAIGPGPFRVLSEEFDPYFAARTLGWRIFKPTGRYIQDSAEYRAFLDSMDFVVLRTRYSFQKVAMDRLEEAGFQHHATVSFPQPDSSTVEWGPFSFKVGTRIYDDLIIYRNDRESTAR